MPPQYPPLAKATKSPTPILDRHVIPDWFALFDVGLTVLPDVVQGQPIQAAPAFLKGMANLFTLKPVSAEEEAFKLVLTAVSRAAMVVLRFAINDTSTREAAATLEFKAKGRELDAVLRRDPVTLDIRFLRRPMKSPIVRTAAQLTATLLRRLSVPEHVVNGAVRFLPGEFLLALIDELNTNPTTYDRFVKKYSPEWRSLTNEEQEWANYHTYLAALADPDVLDLGVQLDQVYVGLRAYTVKSDQNNRSKFTLGKLDDFAEAWLADPADEVFVVSGGPGAGKSAFARRFAAQVAWSGPDPWKVLYVPLHRFEVERNLADAVQAFARAALQSQEPVAAFTPESGDRVLVVFDGLDELSQKGAAGRDAAYEFYDRIHPFLSGCNGGRTPARVKAMVCGRPIAVSQTKAENRQKESVRHVLPFKFDHATWEGHQLTGLESLAKLDQRNEWWKKYGEACHRSDLTGMPKEVDTPALAPLTGEPILNGLVARMWKSGRLKEGVNRADVYDDLLTDVLNRAHDGRQKRHLEKLSDEQVVKLLEEVAVTAWHNGDVRATTKSRVQKRCQDAGLSKLLDEVFPDTEGSDVTRLFLAFYFQSAAPIGEDPAFEFSHKSFGEFLLARRIVRFLEEKSPRWNSTDPDDVKAGGAAWYKLFGPARITEDIYDFVADVALRKSSAEVDGWVQSLVPLFTAAVTRGFDDPEMRHTCFRETEAANQRAATAVILVRSALYRPKQKAIDLPKLRDSIGGDTSIPAAYLPLFVLRRDFLALRGWDFSKARLLGVQLSPTKGVDAKGNVFISMANYRAVATGINMAGSDLFGSSFREIDLSAANFRNADLRYTDLSYSSLVGADLSGADISGSNLRLASLIRANLTSAELIHANLEKATLDGGNIEQANLTGTNLTNEQLLSTIGDPKCLPNGKPPTAKWREKLKAGKSPVRKRTRRKPTTPDSGE